MNGPRDANDILREGGADALRDAFDRAHEDAYDQRKKSNGADEAKRKKANGQYYPHLNFIELARYDHERIPEREWTVLDRFIRGDVGLLSGEGGKGKGILLNQLGVAQVFGRDWLRSIPTMGPVLIVDCEDPYNEIVRRLKPILDHYGENFAAAEQAGLSIISLAGKDSLLMVLDRMTGRVQTTPLFDEILQAAKDIKPVSLIVNNVADIHDCDENNRSQVRQMINILRGLSIAANCGTILSSHPSLTGITSKTGMSGTTHWHNGVRSRAWLRGVTSADGEELNPDLRALEFMKNNYGRLAETITLRWKAGLFLPEPRPGSIEKIAAEAKINDLFVSILERFNEQDRDVSPKPCTTYAPTVFEKESDGTSAKAFTAAMSRLLSAGRIHIEVEGPTSRRRQRLVAGPKP